jgi:hypothetical protein
MPPNLYQPPTAVVSDASSNAPPRPRSVRFACYLILASLALGFVALLPGWDTLRVGTEEGQAAIVWAVYAAFQAIALWLTYATYRRSNWARWALLAYLIFGWLLDAIESTPNFDEWTLASSVYVVVTVMHLAALWLLFTGPGAKWFNGQSTVVSAEA